jgi:hypothetical protein
VSVVVVVNNIIIMFNHELKSDFMEIVVLTARKDNYMYLIVGMLTTHSSFAHLCWLHDSTTSTRRQINSFMLITCSIDTHPPTQIKRQSNAE